MENTPYTKLKSGWKSVFPVGILCVWAVLERTLDPNCSVGGGFLGSPNVLLWIDWLKNKIPPPDCNSKSTYGMVWMCALMLCFAPQEVCTGVGFKFLFSETCTSQFQSDLAHGDKSSCRATTLAREALHEEKVWSSETQTSCFRLAQWPKTRHHDWGDTQMFCSTEKQ